MSFDISAFRNQISKGLGVQSNFRVLFSGPLFRSHSIEAMTFLCNQGSIPGRLIDASDVNTYGTRRRQAHRNVYDDLQLSFYCRDDDLFPKPLFDEWQNAMVEVTTGRANYYDNYACDIEIEQLDTQGNVSYSTRIVDAFPTNVNPMALDWSASGVIHNLSVVFSIRKAIPQRVSLSPFGNWLSANNLYPNLDIDGAIDEFGMSLINRNGVQAIKRWERGRTFAENLADLAF